MRWANARRSFHPDKPEIKPVPFLVPCGFDALACGCLGWAAGLGQASRAAGVMDEEANSVRGCHAGDERECFAGAERGARRAAVDSDSRGHADRRGERSAAEKSAHLRARRAY